MRERKGSSSFYNPTLSANKHVQICRFSLSAASDLPDGSRERGIILTNDKDFLRRKECMHNACDETKNRDFRLISLLWMTNERLLSAPNGTDFASFEDRFSPWTCIHPCLTCVRVRKEHLVGKSLLTKDWRSFSLSIVWWQNSSNKLFFCTENTVQEVSFALSYLAIQHYLLLSMTRSCKPCWPFRFGAPSKFNLPSLPPSKGVFRTICLSLTTGRKQNGGVNKVMRNSYTPMPYPEHFKQQAYMCRFPTEHVQT